MIRPAEALLVLLSSSLTLGAVEIGLRAWHPQIYEHNAMFRRDPGLGWKWIPNKETLFLGISPRVRHSIRTNAEGFRDLPFTPKSPGERRILVLGDSFASNIAVREDRVFARLLEKKLGRTRVFNLGVNGYGQVQEYLVLKDLPEKYAPDLALILIYIRNDFGDNKGYHWVEGLPSPSARLNPDGSGVELLPPGPHAGFPGKRQWIKRLHIAHLMKNAFLILSPRFSPARDGHAASRREPPEYFLCKKASSQEAEELFKIMEFMILKIADLCRWKKIPCLFVLAPSNVQADGNLWTRLLSARGLEAGDFDPALPNNRLVAFARKHGLAMLDLLPRMAGGAAGLYGGDQHWNEAGNEIAAEEMAGVLKRGLETTAAKPFSSRRDR